MWLNFSFTSTRALRDRYFQPSIVKIGDFFSYGGWNRQWFGYFAEFLTNSCKSNACSLNKIPLYAVWFCHFGPTNWIQKFVFQLLWNLLNMMMILLHLTFRLSDPVASFHPSKNKTLRGINRKEILPAEKSSATSAIPIMSDLPKNDICNVSQWKYLIPVKNVRNTSPVKFQKTQGCLAGISSRDLWKHISFTKSFVRKTFSLARCSHAETKLA